MYTPCWFCMTGLMVMALATLVYADAAEHELTPEALFELDTANVNEGELRFLASLPQHDTHLHSNDITLHTTSLEDGWAEVAQCHEHIDAIDNVAITYNPATTRNITLTSSHHIGTAWIENANLELREVAQDARVCVRFDSKVVHSNGDSVTVRTGPYMRRFLDGYYPINVKLDLHYPCEQLTFVRANHINQPGYKLSLGNCQLSLVTHFEGRLISEFVFSRTRTRPP